MKRVLVVDDDPSVQYALSFLLKVGGFEAVPAKSGMEALRIQRERKADVALIDMFMPEMDGIQLMRSFNREFPGTPLIAMSGGHPTSNSLLSVAQKIGAVNALEKPFDTSLLLRALREAIPQET